MKKVTLLVAIVVVMALMLGACGDTTTTTAPADETKTLKVGCIVPLSGPYGFYGLVYTPNTTKYADIINERGGVQIGDDTYMIEMHYYDDAIDPAKGPIVAQQLINDGCVANVGRFSDAPPILGVLMPSKILDLGEAKPGYDFANQKYAIGTSDGAGSFIDVLGTIENMPEVTKMGYLCYDWQSQQSDVAIETWSAPGTVYTERGITMHREMVPMGATDYTTALVKLHESGAQLIECTLGPADYALAIRQAAQLGYVFDGWTSQGTYTDLQEFLDIAGYDNVQETKVMANWPCPWAVEEQTVNPQMVEDAKEICRRLVADAGRPDTMDEYQALCMTPFEWPTGGLAVLLSLYQQAGTTDPDAVMDLVNSGDAVVENFTGTWEFSGEQTFGAAKILPQCGVLGLIQGDTVVRFSEYSNDPIK